MQYPSQYEQALERFTKCIKEFTAGLNKKDYRKNQSIIYTKHKDILQTDNIFKNFQKNTDFLKDHQEDNPCPPLHKPEPTTDINETFFAIQKYLMLSTSSYQTSIW